MIYSPDAAGRDFGKKLVPSGVFLLEKDIQIPYGNPDEALIRRDEFRLLVRILEKISTLINSNVIFLLQTLVLI